MIKCLRPEEAPTVQHNCRGLIHKNDPKLKYKQGSVAVAYYQWMTKRTYPHIGSHKKRRGGIP